MSGKKSSFVSLTQEQYQTLHEHFIKRLFLHSDESTPNPDITSIFQNQVEEGNKQSQDREKSFRTLTSHSTSISETLNWRPVLLSIKPNPTDSKIDRSV